jgi:hypothetical protein
VPGEGEGPAVEDRGDMSAEEITVRDVCEALRKWFDVSPYAGPTSEAPFAKGASWGEAVVIACENADHALGYKRGNLLERGEHE